MLGYTRKEILKLDIGDLSANKPPFTQKEAVKKIRKAIKEGPQVFEWIAKKKNGKTYMRCKQRKHFVLFDEGSSFNGFQADLV